MLVNAMDTEMKIFEKYCEMTGKQESYGIVMSDNGKLYVETLSGRRIDHIAYQYSRAGMYSDLIGDMVFLSYATCGYTKECQIGKPHKKCVDNGTYSLDKCAVVFLEKFNVRAFKYELTLSEFLELASGLVSLHGINLGDGDK